MRQCRERQAVQWAVRQDQQPPGVDADRAGCLTRRERRSSLRLDAGSLTRHESPHQVLERAASRQRDVAQFVRVSSQPCERWSPTK